MQFTSKVIDVKMSQTLKKKDGGEYPAHVLILDGDKGIQKLQLHAKFGIGATKKAVIAKLKAGDLVTVTKEKKGEFWNVTDIDAGSVASSTTNVASATTGKGSYDVQGAIKGNSVTNGVALAIARHGKNTTAKHIQEAALEILEIHRALDKAELPTTASNDKTIASKTVDDDDEAMQQF
jgi:hypothetical protein